MGNLKGGNFDKQVRNALIRLDARGQKRYGTDSRKTHSNALAKKREMYLRDFKEYLEQKGITEGKLNTYINEQNLTEFLNNRLQDLSPKSALDYTTGFNSMLKGLEQTKVNISREVYGVLREYTQDYRTEFNATKDNYETGRAIQDTQAFLNNCDVLRANRVGEFQNWKFYGDSFLFNPHGEMVDYLNDKEELLVVNIDKKEVNIEEFDKINKESRIDIEFEEK